MKVNSISTTNHQKANFGALRISESYKELLTKSLQDSQCMINGKKFTFDSTTELLNAINKTSTSKNMDVVILSPSEHKKILPHRRGKTWNKVKGLPYTQWLLVKSPQKEEKAIQKSKAAKASFTFLRQNFSVKRIVPSNPGHILEALESFAANIGIKIEDFMV